MRAVSLKVLTAVVLIVAVAGCKKNVIDDSTTSTTTVPASEAAVAQTTPVEDAALQGSADNGRTDFTGAGVNSADGFENNPSLYTGDTRTRVIYFAFDRADVPTAAYAALKAHAKALAANPNARLKLEGHSDERGTPEYNVALAERRGNAVEKFLQLNGVPDAQVEVVSFGEEKPADLGHDELAWAKNRRVELIYTAGQP